MRALQALQFIQVDLAPHEAHMVLEILKAHRAHCRKIRPDAQNLLQTMTMVIDRIEERERSVRGA